MNQAEGSTIIGPHTKLRGDLTGTENLLIEGEVEGTISVPGGRVTIGEHGRVRARIFAQEIVVLGRVQGDLLATDAIHLRSSAMVLGNVVSPRFVVEQEALLRGHVEPARATEPASEHIPALHGSEAAAAATGTHPQDTLFGYEGAGFPGLPAGLAAAERQVHEATTPADEVLAESESRSAPSHS